MKVIVQITKHHYTSQYKHLNKLVVLGYTTQLSRSFRTHCAILALRVALERLQIHQEQDPPKSWLGTAFSYGDRH